MCLYVWLGCLSFTMQLGRQPQISSTYVHRAGVSGFGNLLCSQYGTGTLFSRSLLSLASDVTGHRFLLPLPTAPAEKTATCDPSGAFQALLVHPSIYPSPDWLCKISYVRTHACALQRSGVWATHACEESRETTKAQDYRRVYARKRLTTFMHG